MNNLEQLESYAKDLASAVKKFSDHCRSTEIDSITAALPVVPVETDNQVQQARRNILATVAKIQALIRKPEDFLQNLASQIQLLGSIQWLGEFQVLACIPLSGSVPMKDVAELVGVPVPVLTRVVRMTATVRFLCEPQPNHIAHTALSASFVMKPEFLDATKFIAGTAAPAALQMASATQEIRSRELIRGSSLPLNTAQSFQSLFEQAPKLQRQWVTYLGSLAEPEIDEGATDVFRQLDWPRFGAACIIEVDSSPSIMAALIVERHPSLRITLQICENGNRPKHGADSSNNNNNNNNNNNSLHQNSITQSNSPFVTMVTGRRHQGPPAAGSNNNIFLHRRAPGQPQTIKNAGVYILCLPPPSPRNGVSIHAIQSRLIAELRAHLGVLRENRSTILILRMRFLPEHGTVDPEIECVARTRDMTLLQLANEREFEVTEVIDIIQDITDGLGKLTVVSKIRSKNNAVVALGVKFQLNGSH